MEGSSVVTTNQWEEVTKSGNSAIQKWIDDNIYEKSCIVVFVGEKTATRKWIKYEIKKAWNDGKGVFGIYLHNLKYRIGNQANQGDNPFDDFNIGDKKLSSIVKCFSPPYSTCAYVYDHIKENLEDWIEKAIEIRNQY